MSGLPLAPSPQTPAPTTRWRLGNLSLSFGPQLPDQPAPAAAELLIPVGQPLIVQQANLQHILRPPLGLL